MTDEYRAVEIAYRGDVKPGLELLAERRIDGEGDDQQERTVVIIWEDGDRREINIATARVEPANDPDLVEDVLRPKLEGSA